MQHGNTLPPFLQENGTGSQEGNGLLGVILQRGPPSAGFTPIKTQNRDTIANFGIEVRICVRDTYKSYPLWPNFHENVTRTSVS